MSGVGQENCAYQPVVDQSGLYPPSLGGQELAAQIERQVAYEAAMKERAMMEQKERRNASALEAALRCYPHNGDHQQIIRAAREFTAFLQE